MKKKQVKIAAIRLRAAINEDDKMFEEFVIELKHYLK